LPQGGCWGQLDPDRILQLEGEAQFLLVLGTCRRKAAIPAASAAFGLSGHDHRTAVMSGVGLQTRPRARAKYTGIVLPKTGEAAGGGWLATGRRWDLASPRHRETRRGFVSPSNSATGPAALAASTTRNWGLECSSPSHGENRGSSPLGSANKINELWAYFQLKEASVRKIYGIDGPGQWRTSANVYSLMRSASS
jgi:hypothetical protein